MTAEKTLPTAPAPTAPAPGRGQPARGRTLINRRRIVANPAYTRFVMLMKVVFPATAVALLGLVATWPQIAPDASRFRLGTSSVAVPDVDQLRMVNARFLGVDANDQPYVVTAASATQSMGNQKILLLDAPKADLTTKDRAWVALEAAIGTYDQNAEIVHLTGGVMLFHDLGYELTMDTAEVELRTGRALARVPVAGQGPSGTIVAEGMVVEDRGERIHFTGRARLVLTGEPVTAAR